MGFFFTPHARDRAREHYGLELSAAEIGGILKACTEGQASLLRDHIHGQVYAWKVGHQWIYPVIREGVVRTFLPPDFMLASSAKKWRQQKAMDAHV